MLNISYIKGSIRSIASIGYEVQMLNDSSVETPNWSAIADLVVRHASFAIAQESAVEILKECFQNLGTEDMPQWQWQEQPDYVYLDAIEKYE